jgi:hypothetical protein
MNRDIPMTSLDDQIKSRLNITEEQLAAFCLKWKIVEFALFGSVLTDEFRPDSDVDVMVTFDKDAHWGIEIVTIGDELMEMLGREVDLVTRPSVERSENYLMRRSILSNTRTIYAP